MTTRANEFKVRWHTEGRSTTYERCMRGTENVYFIWSIGRKGRKTRRRRRAEVRQNETENKRQKTITQTQACWGTPGTRYCSWKQKQTVACLLFAYLLLLPSVFMSTLQMPPSSLIFPIMIHVTLRGLLYNVYCGCGRWCWSSGFYWLLVSRWRVLARCRACGLCCYCHPSYPAAITIVINNHHQQDLDAFYIYLHGIPYLTPSYSMSQILIWSIINVWRQTISIASYYYL